IENYIPANNRSQLMVRNEVEIILDAYNANPSSMAAALAHFSALDKPKKVAVLGDMFELGAESLSEHKNIIELMGGRPEIETWFIGKDFFTNKTAHSHLHFFENFEDFSTSFHKGEARMILIKGSRGMALERTLDLL
ncbi:MAG TPA: cyanophycin synthetase, partial [Flavobacterium sp.]|nr:cyanophycin synthetase [Flavobacterium sp.]